MTTVNDMQGSSLQLVQICGEGGNWAALCDNEWTAHDATIICRELNYSSVGKYSHFSNPNSRNTNNNESHSTTHTEHWAEPTVYTHMNNGLFNNTK